MAFKKIRLYIPELSLVLLMFSILGTMVLFNDIIKYIGLANLEIKLLHKNREDSNKDFLGMLAKYKLHKKLYEARISEHELNLAELKTNQLISLKDSAVPVGLKRYQRIYRPALFLLNGLRYILGLPPIELELETISSQYLTVGYYLERNKSYTSALKLYEGALKKVSPQDHRYPILVLHQGFCHSIIGNYEQAKESYQKVIDDYSEKKIAETAQILLSYIVEFEEEVNRIKSIEADSLEKSEKLFKLIAYEEALKTLDNVTPTDEKEAEKLKFYKGRSNEELGNTTKSVEIYQDIIDTNPESEYSKLSNRRILSISSTSSNNSLKAMAEKNNDKIADPEFAKYKEIVESSTGESNEASLELIKKESFKDSELIMIVDEHLKAEETIVAEIEEVEKVYAEKRAEPEEKIVTVDETADETGDQLLESEEEETEKPVEEESAEAGADDKEKDKEEEKEEKVTERIVEKIIIKPDPASEEQKRQLRILRARVNQLIASNKKLVNENARLEDLLSDTKDKSESEIVALKEQQDKLQKDMTELDNLKIALEKQVEELTAAREQQEQEKSIEEKADKVVDSYGPKTREKQREVTTNRDQYGRIISRITYKWNENDEKVTERYEIYYYRNDGKNFKIMEYNGEHELISYLIIEYDEEGNQTRVVRYDAEGNVKFE